MKEEEITVLMEREYTFKLSERLGRGGEGVTLTPNPSAMPTVGPDFAFLRSVSDAYQRADAKTKEAFATICVSILKLPSSGSSASGH